MEDNLNWHMAIYRAGSEGTCCVYLLGAGPGDPELLTVRAARILRRAEAVLYDELIQKPILDLAPAKAERLYVGKRAGCHAAPQPEIISWLVERARQGKCTVRLKGGDPFIFGRGGEEAEALSAAGIRWELVPGLSAGLALPELAHIPLTHRGIATSVAFASGHAREGDAPPLPQADTLVIFMGLANLEEWTQQLMRAGRAGETPAIAIENGSLQNERILEAPLQQLAQAVAAAAMRSPVLIVVGEVVKLRAKLLGQAAIVNTLPAEPRPGLILLSHGSPLGSWEASMNRLLDDLGGAYPWRRAAYLEPARPTLEEMVVKALQDGLRDVIVMPYFLASGLHVTRDIPENTGRLRQKYPRLTIHLAQSLEGHPALRTAVLSRAREARNLTQTQP